METQARAVWEESGRQRYKETSLELDTLQTALVYVTAKMQIPTELSSQQRGYTYLKGTKMT